jgi:hypothetical protein
MEIIHDRYKAFEKFDLSMMEFYQKDLAELIRLKEIFEDEPEIREPIRDLIVEADYSIKLLKKGIERDRETARSFTRI